MPTYEYECDACGHTFEEFQSMSDAVLTKCPQCKRKKLKRLIGAGAGIIFKGSGFYETDYKRKNEPKPASEAPAAKSETKTEAKSESKSETKPASPAKAS